MIPPSPPSPSSPSPVPCASVIHTAYRLVEATSRPLHPPLSPFDDLENFPPYGYCSGSSVAQLLDICSTTSRSWIRPCACPLRFSFSHAHVVRSLAYSLTKPLSRSTTTPDAFDASSRHPSRFVAWVEIAPMLLKLSTSWMPSCACWSTTPLPRASAQFTQHFLRDIPLRRRCGFVDAPRYSFSIVAPNNIVLDSSTTLPHSGAITPDKISPPPLLDILPGSRSPRACSLHWSSSAAQNVSKWGYFSGDAK
ncbi:hypothetical protein R3P38DRAFT_3175486 [Favolaschia claudopus]|uniref:Uncharacterized protein n=1 Tax=Favolaschia claudopus TaxID=2862362 RepID=A0AAW0D386_9AGAR